MTRRPYVAIVIFAALALVPLLGLFIRDGYILSLVTRVMISPSRRSRST